MTEPYDHDGVSIWDVLRGGLPYSEDQDEQVEVESKSRGSKGLCGSYPVLPEPAEQESENECSDL